MPYFARLLIFVGLLLAVLGALLLGLERLHLPLGHLPGDLTWRGRGWVVSIPLATSVLLSLLLSVLVWLVSRLRR